MLPRLSFSAAGEEYVSLEFTWHGIMSLVKCEVCRNYYQEEQSHSCPGLRSVDWVRFVRSLRDWASTDKNALFEVYYAQRRVKKHQNGEASS